MKAILILLAIILVAIPAYSASDEDLAKNLEKLEKQIKENPDDPMLVYRKAQCLMKLKKYEEGYQTAKEAMALFIKADNDLAWMLLESIDLEKVRVDVHFNMGPDERKPPEIAIIRPLSFRIWSKDEDPKLIEIIDFEISYFDGEPMTAALGKTTEEEHANYGMLDTDAKYEQIREKAIKLIKERHKQTK